MVHETALILAETTANNNSDSVTWTGAWENQMGSTMDLSLTGNNLTGTYTSANSASGPPVTGPLVGFAIGDRLAFSVLWPSGSITAWTGQIVDDLSNPTIKTLWHLISDISEDDESRKFWQSTLAGTDVFNRPKPPA